MSGTQGHLTRRDFLLRGGAVLAGMLVMPSTVVALPQTAEAAARVRKGYEFLHNEDIAICLDRAADPRKLDISVGRGGTEIENFANVHPARLRRLDSRHFRVRYIKPPGTK